ADGALAQPIGERLGKPVHRNRAELCAVVELQASLGDATEAVRLLQDRVKYWREISGRRIDDLQHLGGRGLLLKPLRKIARLGLHLIEQPGVLDRNHGLGRKGLEEVDM